MPRRFRTPPPKRADLMGKTLNKASQIIAKAKRTADQITRAAEKRDRIVDHKFDILDSLLPNGFTAAPNIDILPPQIQERIKRPVQEVIEGATMSSFIATPAQRALVYDYAKFGVPISDILLRLINPVTAKPISVDTFRRHFGDDFDLGLADGNIDVAKTAHVMAVGRAAEYDDKGEMIRPEKDPNPSVLIAVAKNRLGWTTKKDVTITHNSGVDPQTAEALRELSEDELRQLRAIATGRRASKSEGGREGD